MNNNSLNILEISQNKKEYLELLLLGDEQESMIDKYLERGRMFVLFFNSKPCAEAVVTDEGERICELKNIAVSPQFQRKGCGKYLIDFLCRKLKGNFDIMTVGTGESDLTVPFYKNCGFSYFKRIKNFFTDNYDHPIYECGKLLQDMIYLKKRL